MPNYIETSPQISEWLKGQGIEIEVDGFAPVVYKITNAHSLTGILKIGFYGIVVERGDGRELGCEYLCPFFGPGGEGNLLKALRAWCEKNGCYFASDKERDDKGDDVEWFLQSYELKKQTYGPPPYEQETVPVFQIEAQGKTDGIALHDLLVKLMEAK